MKNTKKRLGIVLIPLLVALLVGLLASCGNEGGNTDAISALYAEAQGLGFTGTRAEFIETLKGANGEAGADGVGIESMRVTDSGFLTITLTDGSTVNCGKVGGLNGEQGADGKNGQNGLPGRDGADGENGKSAYEIAVENGYQGTEKEWLDEIVAVAVRELVDTGATIDERMVMDAMKKIPDSFTDCFEVAHRKDSEEITPNVTSGYMDYRNGTAHDNSQSQNYCYTDPIAVSEGDRISNPDGSMRFVAAFKSGVIDATLGTENASFYTVPAGVDSVRLTFVRTAEPKVVIERDRTVVVLKETCYPDKLATLLSSSFGKNAGAVVTSALGSEIITAEKESLAPGEQILMEKNVICNEKHLTFTADLSSCGLIRVGHGKDYYNGNYVEVTDEAITVFAYNAALSTVKTEKHGLTLSGYVTLVIDVNYGYADISLSSPSGMFQMKDVSWLGRNGEIFAEVEDCTLTNVKMKWNCEGFSYNLWAFGDSYFNPTDPSRWPSYLGQNGHTHNLLFGYSGMASAAALTNFKQALTHGTPKYAVWCMGMNDSSFDAWLSCVTEFLELCDQNGITPILSTVPCVPARDNTDKNAWVRKSGYRYIDFAHAVGAESAGSTWYADMLYTGDNVHPAKLGAQALYMQAITDCPELLDD